MTPDELAELMAEPPGGHNHGRTRAGGKWHALETLESEVMELDDVYVIEEPTSQTPRRKPNKPVDTINHGTRAAYVNDRCRCDECRQAERDYKRRRRQQG